MTKKSLTGLLLIFVAGLLAAGSLLIPVGNTKGRRVERKPRQFTKQATAQAGPIFLGSDSVPPYEWNIDTRQFPDGPKTFYAIAYDAAGNQTTSEPITVIIDNSTGWCNDNGICETDEDCDVCPNDCFRTDGSCCGNDFCELNETCSNCETDCGVCPFCGDGTCNSNEGKCSCPEDCGSAPVSERMVPDISNSTCWNGADDDCDGTVDCNDSDCVDDPACVVQPVCNSNGICGGDEDCNNCSDDCSALTGSVCGNNRCETANFENCLNCPQDCNGKQGGKKKDRYCCGFAAAGANPIPCTDNRCNQNRKICTDVMVVSSCCGDGLCEGNEGSCDCEKDCGQRDLQELVGSSCRDGVDNDCDSMVDCNDPDCLADSNCRQGCDNNGTCELGESCQNCSDCPGVLKGKPARRHCCGNGQLESAEGNGSICDGNP